MASLGRLSRRVLLAGTGGVLLASFTWQEGFGAPSGGVEPIADFVDVFVSPTSVQPVPRALGFVVRDPWTKVERYEASGDASSYDVAPEATVDAAGTLAKAKIRRAAPRTPNQPTLRVDLADRAAVTEVLVGVLPTEQPNWAISSVVTPTQQSAVMSDGTRASLTPPPAVAVEAWGVRVATQWDRISWSGRYRSYTPTQVIVTSQGPFSTPQRLTLHLQLDPRLVAKINSVTLLEGGKKVRLGAPRQIAAGEWAVDLHGSIPAGESVRIAVRVDAKAPTGPLPGFRTPVVDARALTADRAQWVTGGESSTRIDSIIDDASAREWGM